MILNVMLAVSLVAFAIVGMALFDRSVSRTDKAANQTASFVERILALGLLLSAVPLIQMHPLFGKASLYIIVFVAAMGLGTLLAAQILSRGIAFPRQILTPLGIVAAAYLLVQCAVLLALPDLVR